ncbi:MAG: DUF86 domain-containing protein [Rhodopila sp.]|nr:DUF86 domain-containing protein [Rhodopila sp.]
MPSNRHRRIDCLQDIIDNIARIEAYSDGLEQDSLRHDAVQRCLERICEAAFRLGDHAATLLPAQPWADIRGMGNRLRHAYDQMDVRILWNVVSERLPGLQADAATALARLTGDAGS